MRGEYQNTYEKIGTMQIHKPEIRYARVDEDTGVMRANWTMELDKESVTIGDQINLDIN